MGSKEKSINVFLVLLLFGLELIEVSARSLRVSLMSLAVKR